MGTAGAGSVKKYVAVYIALLVITALEFLVGYKGEGSGLALRFLTFAIIDTILVMLFFMSLGTEKPGFIKFFVYFMLFVLATMNYVWTDSFRLLLFRLTGYMPT